MAVKDKKVGKQTIKLENPPKIISTYSIVGPKEGDGPLKDYFHQIISNVRAYMEALLQLFYYWVLNY